MVNQFLIDSKINKFLGIGDWGWGLGPNPQSPIPNPQSPIPKELYYIFYTK